ncbi:hypothetical protein N7G274_009910 [Stereocaulon virgatum]|uniref:FAD-binding domain-containing protein n=1 Tax=Stereocaulon virgatum TaxID=373712 RepID=A0ABR3ZXE1_9LECA
MSSPPITIVGAGLAGLTLGRCLKARGVSTQLLERASSTLIYNYGITLHQWTYQPLLNVLNMDESLFRSKVAVDASQGGTGALSRPLEGSVSSGAFRCHRGRLEAMLREGLDIKWEHPVESVEASSQNIKTSVQNGDSINSDTIVGSDGVHSQVRKSSASWIEPKVLPYVVFHGTRKMAVDEYQYVLAPYMKGCAVIQSRHEDAMLEIAINDYDETGIHIGYTYSRPAHQNDSLHKPDRPISGASDIPEDFYVELGGLKALEEPFAQIFSASKVRHDRISHWLMRSSLPKEDDIKNLTARGVLLIGDAIHAMPILGGEGGNMAIRDGINLAEHLAEHGFSCIRYFYEGRYPIWRQAVENSEKTLSDMHTPVKPLL